MENKTGAIIGMILGYSSKFVTNDFLQEIGTTIILAIVGAAIGTMTQLLIKKYFTKKEKTNV